MWIICGILSLGFTLWNGITIFQTGKVSGLLTTSALSFAVLTVLAAYHQIALWIARADWAALMDVVPTMAGLFAAYAALMIVCNGVPWVLRYRKLIATHTEK